MCTRPASRSINTPLHSILFQRGVYPADDFHMVKKYGQTVLITQDLALENYLEKYSPFRLLPACDSHTVSRILKQISSKRMVPP